MSSHLCALVKERFWEDNINLWHCFDHSIELIHETVPYAMMSTLPY